MNQLQIGLADKVFKAKRGFLLIDDGPLADTFLSKFKRAKEFDPRKHGLNPLPMQYREAREFAAVIYGDEGRDTLTARNGKRALTRLLMAAERIDKLEPTRSDEDKEASAIVDDMLLSPVLKKCLCKAAPRWLLSGSSIVARINRAELGDHDARILGSLLISQFKGQLIIPDFGFYARDFHGSLVREDRLMAGVFTLSELSDKLRRICLLMPKAGRKCTFEDAEVLAKYEGLRPDPAREKNPYNEFIDRCMSA